MQDLLLRAKKIKERLQPALKKENQDHATRRRLQFLNQVLTKVIDRFEENFPECRHAHVSASEADSSDEDIFDEGEDQGTPSPPPATFLRRTNSMTEIAKKLELEEGDVHRFRSFVHKRDSVGAEAELTGEQLLQAILKVDKVRLERDDDSLNEVLTRSIIHGSGQDASTEESEKPIGLVRRGIDFDKISFPQTEKKDIDMHSI